MNGENLLREILIGVLGVVCVMAVMLLIGVGDSTLALACVAFAAVVLQAGMHQGAWAGGATGLAAAAGLLLLQQKTGAPPDAFIVLAALGLPAMGLLFGVGLAAHRVSADESEQARVELRRELYRLKKASREGHRHDPQAPVRPVEPDPRDPAAPAVVDTETLERVVGQIANSLTEHRVIEATLSSVRELLGVDQVKLHLHERGTDLFLPGRTISAESGEQPVGENETLLQLVRSRRELLCRASSDESVSRAFSVARPELELAVPIFDRAMLTGVLLTSRPERPGPDGNRLITVLAAASGLALSAARLAARLEEKNRRDPLTGLLDLTSVRALLEQGLARGPVAVLLVAADGIQTVNETYGRRSGDKVVAALARLLSMEIGAAGQVGRYGGATVLVVLAGHRLEAARELALRVKRRVPLTLHAGPEGLAGPLTVSVGVAAASAGSVDVLTQAAEQSLSEDQQSAGLAETRISGEGEASHARR